jgi:hypothetical protein
MVFKEITTLTIKGSSGETLTFADLKGFRIVLSDDNTQATLELNSNE